MNNRNCSRSKLMLKLCGVKGEDVESISPNINPSCSATVTGDEIAKGSDSINRQSGHFYSRLEPVVLPKYLVATDYNRSLTGESLNVYGSPVPSPFKECNKNLDDNENKTDLSDLFDSDDSVADPDFSMTDLLKHNSKRSLSETSIDSDDDTDFGHNATAALPNILPPSLDEPNQLKSIYIAPNPNSVVFLDHQQAAYHAEPVNGNEAEHKNTADLIAKYPEPIFSNKESNINDSHSNSGINIHLDAEEPAQNLPNRIPTSKVIDKINTAKMKHPFIEQDCGGKCKRKCNLFTVDERKTIWNTYWNMKYAMRRNFLNKCTKIENIKRKIVVEAHPNPKYHRKESRFYYLPKNNEEINVCRSFFLNTLGHRTDAFLTELSRAIKRKALYGDVKENRGGKKPKIDRSPIETHIMNYNPAVSHYRKSNAPLARYLPRTLTVNKMFSDFKSKYPNETCSNEVYRQTIKNMNISFNFPKGDKCVDCETYEEAMKTYNDDVPENIRNAYLSHKTKSNKAVQKYQEDASQENSSSVRYYSMDLQKVMLLPHMPKVKDSFFLSRLIAFNLTFAPIKKKTKVNSICVLWHEAYAGRDANNIVDAIVKFIVKERDMQHLILWCDNCSSQNKN